MRPALKFFYSFFQSEKGFSLTELLVVVGILGVLSAVAIPTYSKYKIGVLQTIQKSELVAVSKYLYHTHNVDGGYHQKIWAMGYRPNKIMQTQIGMDYARGVASPICCNKFPQDATTATNRASNYFTLTSNIYTVTHDDSFTNIEQMCTGGKCELKYYKHHSQWAIKHSGLAGDCWSDFNQKSIKCTCDTFILLATNNIKGNIPRAFMNNKGLICKSTGNITTNINKF